MLTLDRRAARTHAAPGVVAGEPSSSPPPAPERDAQPPGGAQRRTLARTAEAVLGVRAF